METFKPAWLLERELPSQLLQVGTQLLTLPSSSKDLIGLLDTVGSLLSQVYQNPSKSVQDVLVSIKGVLILDVLTNQADLDVQISLASCLSELIHITTPNPPFVDEPMKKAFRVIESSFRALPDSASADKSYHKRVHILESMSRVKSYVVLLDLECDALVLDICHNLLSSIKDDHSYMMLAYVESVLVGILFLTEADDFLLEFLISILSRSHQVISKRVLETCASRIPLQQILSSIDAMMHNKENEAHNGQLEVEIIESDACNGATLDEECRKATSECKLVPTTKDIQFWYPEVKHV